MNSTKKFFYVFFIFFLIGLEVTSLFLDKLFNKNYNFVDFKNNNQYKNLNLEAKNYNFHNQRFKHLHPFFAYSTPSKQEDIAKKIKNEGMYNIGIFGGSVADSFSQFINKHDGFKKSLSNILNVKKEKIQFINFTNSGYRQPQQYFIATIYSEYINLSISIEGVNEISRRSSSFPTYFPMTSISNVYYSSLVKLEKVNIIKKKFEEMTTLKKRFMTEKYIFKSFKIYDYFKIKLLEKEIIKNNFENEKQEFNFNHKIFKNNFKEKMKIWFKMSCLQQNLFSSETVPSFFFIQPIPKENDYPENKNKKSLVKYRKKLSENKVKLIRESGLNFYSLIDHFDQQNQNLFIDSCCHLNEKGNKEIMSEITKIIFKKIRNLRECNFQNIRNILDTL